MLRKSIKIIFLVSWMALIFSFSMDNGVESKEKSRGIITWVNDVFLNISGEENIEKYEFFVRKTAHFFLYFVLGGLFILVLKEYHVLSTRDFLFACCFVFLYACSDEVHQLFVSERSGQISDVMLDTLAGSLSSLILFLGGKKYHEKTTTR